LSISQKTLRTLPADGTVMPKHVGATIRNQETEIIIGVFVGFSLIFLLVILIFKELTGRRLYKSFCVKEIKKPRPCKCRQRKKLYIGRIYTEFILII
jgi:hypothetical protein